MREPHYHVRLLRWRSVIWTQNFYMGQVQAAEAEAERLQHKVTNQRGMSVKVETCWLYECKWRFVTEDGKPLDIVVPSRQRKKAAPKSTVIDFRPQREKRKPRPRGPRFYDPEKPAIN
jgi:hypothetical protein